MGITDTEQGKALLALLHEGDPKSIILCCHHNADPDTLCSAYALSKLLEKIIPEAEVTIAAPSLSKLSKHIVGKIAIEVTTSPDFEQVDVIILVDMNTLQQVNDWKTRIETVGKPIAIIDHHATHDETKNMVDLQITNEWASSTCEMVYELFEEASIPLKKKEALALFVGMAYDSRHFSIANSNTFKIAVCLIDQGADAEAALALLEQPLDASERIARLKAANRLRLAKIGGWLFGFSEISSYQAASARALVRLGVHVAIVGGKKKEELQISIRSSRQFHVKTKIHLGRDIAASLGSYVQGMGGGHSTAAGINGKGDVESALKECEKKFHQLLDVSPIYASNIKAK